MNLLKYVCIRYWGSYWINELLSRRKDQAHARYLLKRLTRGASHVSLPQPSQKSRLLLVQLVLGRLLAWGHRKWRNCPTRKHGIILDPREWPCGNHPGALLRVSCETESSPNQQKVDMRPQCAHECCRHLRVCSWGVPCSTGSGLRWRSFQKAGTAWEGKSSLHCTPPPSNWCFLWGIVRLNPPKACETTL